MRVLFERKLATGPAVSCEGGPLGLVELAAVVSAVSSRQAG